MTLPSWQMPSPFTLQTPNSHLCHQITSKSNSLPDGCVFISVIVGDYLVLVVLTICVNLSSHSYKQTADGWSWKSESLAFLGTLTLSHDLFPFFVYWKKKRQLISHFSNQTFPAFIGKHSEQDEIYYPFRGLGLHQRLPDGQVQKTFVNEGDQNLFIFKLVNFTLRPAWVRPSSHSLESLPNARSHSSRVWKINQLVPGNLV